MNNFPSSSELPIIPGYYWYTDDRFSWPQIVEVRFLDDGLVCQAYMKWDCEDVFDEDFIKSVNPKWGRRIEEPI